MKLVLVRHGESVWNKKNIFTGWTDVGLTEKGIEEAKEAGRRLKNKNFSFTICHTSILKRAIETMDYIFDEMQIKPQIYKTYQLNERHYGALQGLNKEEMAEKVGAEQVKKWRRSLRERPPALSLDDERHPQHNPLFKNIKNLPASESLADTMDRVVDYYEKEIKFQILNGEDIIIVAHGNSLRALVAYLENYNEEQILALNIPTGIPLVYEIDKNIKILKKYYLE